MLGKHQLGFVIVLVVLLGLASTALAGTQSTIFLPLATSDEQMGEQPPEQSDLDDTFDEMGFEGLDISEEFSASDPPSFVQSGHCTICRHVAQTSFSVALP